MLLRPLCIDDSEVIYKSWATDPEVAKYMIWNLHKNLKDTADWIKAEISGIEDEKNYTWGLVLKETSSLIGSAGIVFNPEINMYELGYNIMRKYWRMGLTTEAVREIIDFSMNQLKIDRIFAKIAVENSASERIIIKSGFEYLRDGQYSKLDGSESFKSREYILHGK